MTGEKLKVLGTSTVVKGYKTTIIKRVAQKLGIKEGDLLVYYEDEKGRIILAKSEP